MEQQDIPEVGEMDNFSWEQKIVSMGANAIALRLGQLKKQMSRLTEEQEDIRNEKILAARKYAFLLRLELDVSSYENDKWGYEWTATNGKILCCGTVRASSKEKAREIAALHLAGEEPPAYGV